MSISNWEQLKTYEDNIREEGDLRHLTGEALLYLTAHVTSQHEVDHGPGQVAAHHHVGGIVEG